MYAGICENLPVLGDDNPAVSANRENDHIPESDSEVEVRQADVQQGQVPALAEDAEQVRLLQLLHKNRH